MRALLCLALLGALVSGCTSDPPAEPGRDASASNRIVKLPSGGLGNCRSYYQLRGIAPTWPRLQDVLVGQERGGRVASVRVQQRGADLGIGHHEVVRVIDLLDEDGRRLAQAEVWRTPDDQWRAGVWNQCID